MGIRTESWGFKHGPEMTSENLLRHPDSEKPRDGKHKGYRKNNSIKNVVHLFLILILLFAKWSVFLTLWNVAECRSSPLGGK